MKRWLIFLIFALMFIFSYFIRLSTGVLAPNLMRDLQLNADQMGFLSGIFFYVFALMQIPVGLALDSFSPKRVVLSTTIFSAVGCYVLSIAQVYKTAIIGRIFIGIGMSAVLIGSFKIYNNWFRSNEFGFISGLMLSIGNFGALLAGAPLAFIASLIGWRKCFMIFSGFVILITTLIFFFVKDSPKEGNQYISPIKSKKIQNSFFSILPIISNRNFWLISISSLIRYGSLISIQGFIGTLYLIDVLKFNSQESGNILTMISIGYLIGSPIAGYLSDKIFQSRKKVVVVGLLLFIVWILPFLWNGTKNYIFWSITFFNLGLSASIGAVSFTHIKELFPKEVIGLALTTTNLFNIGGAGIGQHLLGIIIARFPKTTSGYPIEAYYQVFLIILIISFFSFIIYLFVKDTNPSSFSHIT